jgi:group I intron endonuclease
MDKQKPSFVYKITNLINGKIYIGITSRSLKTRMTEHMKPSRSARSRIGAAIKCHGKDAFKMSLILECATFDEAKAEERRLIALLKPDYNLTEGGDGFLGGKHSPEQRAKWSVERRGKPGKSYRMSEAAKRALSEKRKGKRTGLPAGWKHKPESIEKMRQATRGQPGYWKGKKLPEHVVRQMSERHSDPEWRAKWEASINYKPKPPKKRKLLGKKVLCLDGGIIYSSATLAAVFYHTTTGNITNACRGDKGSYTAVGRRFRYLDSPEPNYEQKERERAAGLLRCGATPIRCITDGREFLSTTKAERFYGISRCAIKRVCDGKSGSTRGLVFEFVRAT